MYKTMMLYILSTFLLLQHATAFPNNNLHQLKVDFSPPEEVNADFQRRHFTRSINEVSQPKNTIEGTIKEVEELIKQDPNLPRLTRGEIIDILENLTKEEGGRNPKAIMVVRPYTPEVGNSKNMEELFTKPPVTQIIGNENSTVKKMRVTTTTSTTTTTTEKSKTSTDSVVPLKPLKRRRPSLSTTSTTKRPVTHQNMAVTTYHPPRKNLSIRRNKPQKFSNHKYSEENVSSNSGIRVVPPPKLVTTTNNYDQEMMQAEENYNKQQTVVPFKKIPVPEPSIELIVPEHLKKVVGDLNLDNLESMEQKNKEEEAERIKEILASIGIQDLPVVTTTTTTSRPDASVVADNLSSDMKELLVTFGLLNDPNKNINKNDKMDDDFGPEKAEIEAESYMGFKPLPSDDVSTKSEMEQLLAQFGLGRSARKQKSVTKTNNNNNRNLDFVPDIYKDVLQDIGIVERGARKIRANIEEKTQEKQHVFTPAKYDEYTTISEIHKVEKLKKLMNAIKELEKLNRTITQDDMKSVDIDDLKQLLSSLNQNNAQQKSHILDEDSAPNPLDFDQGIVKNEVKRQSSTTEATLEIKSTTEGDVKTTVDEQRLKDLEDSFGGKKDTPSTTEMPTESTTQMRKTGFYYLVDWNTFLDIDDQKGKRVNLRFQPTVGDPKRFFAVNVP